MEMWNNTESNTLENLLFCLERLEKNKNTKIIAEDILLIDSDGEQSYHFHYIDIFNKLSREEKISILRKYATGLAVSILREHEMTKTLLIRYKNKLKPW